MAYKGFKGSGMNSAHGRKISQKELAILADLYAQKMMLDFQKAAKKVSDKEDAELRERMGANETSNMV